ncbi:MAG: HK97 gp10 family phage protein [Clostridia bacterium]|nr:HK97 gp10 family phage protein [Clostridia bacterium]
MARNDGVKFTDNSVQVKAELNKALIAFLREASAEVKTQAERYTPTGEGAQLKRHWDTVIDQGNMQAIIGNTLEYAIYQEMGTGEYALEGKGRKGYWVYVKDGDTGKMSKSSKSYTLAEARRIMALLREKGLEAYYTKGTRPKRMLYKSFKMWKPKIEARAKQIFKERGF